MINTYKKRILTSIIIALIITLNLSLGTLAKNNKLKVHFLNVGQADSIFIELPNGENMLIDAGNNEDSPMIINYIKNKAVSKIDYLVGTHPHEDHIGGLDEIIYSFNIAKFYMPNVRHTIQAFEDVLSAIRFKGKKINAAKAENTITPLLLS
jgi:beta-lactamase superfamily II metal-dependent hydrolase